MTAGWGTHGALEPLPFSAGRTSHGPAQNHSKISIRVRHRKRTWTFVVSLPCCLPLFHGRRVDCLFHIKLRSYRPLPLAQGVQCELVLECRGVVLHVRRNERLLLVGMGKSGRPSGGARLQRGKGAGEGKKGAGRGQGQRFFKVHAVAKDVLDARYCRRHRRGGGG